MKKLLLITAGAWILCTASMKAQITLDYSNDTLFFGGSSFYCIDISENESKYVHFTPNTNSFSLYNMDMTSFISNITIPVTDSLKNGFVVMYITRTLFDCDSSNIEYAYSKPVGSPASFRIFRTDGTLLLEVDSARGPYSFGGSTGGSVTIRPIKNTSDGTKLFLDKLNPSGGGILIYSLCGTVYTDYFDFIESKSYLTLRPNPSNARIDFEVIAPNNREEFEIVIYRSDGIILQRNTIQSSNDKFTLDVSGLSSGMYFYSLVTKKKSYQTGRFIITK